MAEAYASFAARGMHCNAIAILEVTDPSGNRLSVPDANCQQAIDQEIAERSGPVRFRWVRGHVGNHFNEVADTLAGAAAREAAARPGPIEVPRSVRHVVKPVVARGTDDTELTLF